MNNKRQRNKLFTMLLLVILVPCIAWAHEGSYDDNGFCTDEECTEKYQPAELNKIDDWYEISNAGQLYWFAEQVSNGNTDLINANVRLTQDIIDNDVQFSYDAENDYAPIAKKGNGDDVDVNNLRVWNPIGTRDGWQTDIGGGELADENYPDKQKWFGGYFDGKGFSISGLYFNNESLHCGLFANLRYTAVIENVIMNNCYLKGKIVGIIASRAEGSTISRCINNCIIYGKSIAGGILGLTQSRFQDNSTKLLKEIGVYNCINKGTVLGHYAGGIIGRGSYTWNEGKLSNLINVGNIIAKKMASITTYIGEIMAQANDDYTLKSCFGYDSTNLLIGNNISKTILFSKILPITDFYNGKVAYFLSLSDEKWGQDLSQPKSIPSYGGAKVFKLCGENYTNDANAIAEHSWEYGVCTKCDDKQEAIFNTEKNSYEISNLGQLLWFDERFGLEGLKQDDYANAFLTSDITINKATLGYDGEQNKVLVNGDTDKESSLRGWKTLGNTHNFEGNGHTISGLYALTSTYSRNRTGFCNGEVQNLTLSNAVVIATSDDYIGGFAGITYEPLKNCHFKGVVIGKYVGGIACRSYNSITNCSFVGKIYDGKGGSETLGGLVGKNNGSITNCAFLGECINENKIVRLVGTNSGAISNCYLSSSTSESGNEKIPCTIVDTNSGTTQKIAYDANKLTLSSEDEAFKAFTTEQIKSGEVTYWLNDCKSDGTIAWHQKLGEGGDEHPVLISTGNNSVYNAYQHGTTNQFYSNDVNSHKLAYNAEAEDEVNGNHDISYEAGDYVWTDAEDKTQDPTVAVTYTCEVCGKEVTPQMTVEHDAEHDNVEATCTEEGHKYYKATYAFNDKAVFINAYVQTQKALGHNMSDEVTFNDSKSIYQKGCTRGCGYHDYYATSDGSVEAKENGDAYGFIVDEFSLDDATAYDNRARFIVKELTYKRTFSNDKWQAVYVPFDIECGQISDDYEVACINNFHEYEMPDGSTNVELEVMRITNAAVIPALTPCLIRKKQVSADIESASKKFYFADVYFKPASDRVIDCASVTRYYEFFGTLQGKSGFDPYSEFCLTSDGLVRVYDDKPLEPQRWYLKATDRIGGLLYPTEMLSRIAIRVIGDDEPTGIEGIYVKTDTSVANGSQQGIYDLQGRKLNQKLESGIYIKNGKKYVK